MGKNILFFIFALIFIASCENQVNQQNNQQNADISPYSCNADNDCEVKDVHNCCGYYPRCVNKNYVPDIEAVKMECKEKGIVSVCGWADIEQCKCISNECKGMQGDKTV